MNSEIYFSLINAARLYDINPENGLEHTDKSLYDGLTTSNRKHYKR